MSYDVVVVGAGFAGASIAYFLGRLGVKTLIADLKPWDFVGSKPCGDAVGKHHFDELSMPYPKGDELEGIVKGISIYSPSEQHEVFVSGEGFEIHRIKYTQRLLSDAISRGVEFLGGTHFREPIIKDDHVVGVKIWSGGAKEIFSKVVIDASGNARAVVRFLPKSWPVNEELVLGDANIAYREIRVLENHIDNPEVLRIYINNDVAPGGYWWYFPYSKMERTVNIGLGIRGDLRGLHPKELLYKHVFSRPEFKGSKVVESGGALVPTRRPIPSLVWNGIAVIGDAAYVVNPVHGGGKGSSMISAKCVSEAIKNALEVGSTSAKDLWEANTCYMIKYGGKQGSLDIFRYFLQKLSNDDLEFSISKKLVNGNELNEISLRGKFEVGLVDKILKLSSLLSRPSLLLKLRTVVKYMDLIKEHYLKYPSTPEGLNKWLHDLNKILKNYHDSLM
ncbi:MAG: NAD(P)/FAD-dependent oxidoreductase [Sulfolobales archaeon]|nr:NAD(P)/FAD-dependent oxidoreductase [Sulfolobales archaeon]MCX8186055.1 NAD(P)/FAD-dependent oxidoreductase [Sulfolobales archaeon]